MKEFWIDSLGIKSALRNLKFAILLGAMIFAICATVHAQQPTKIPRIGYLSSGSSAARHSPRAEAFRQGLLELGYVEGKNIAFEYRNAEGKLDRIPDLAAELVRMKVDVILTGGNSAIRAAKKATSTIPIVMPHTADPVADGFVVSLARPGGNITGFTSSPGYELSGKRLELLKETLPRATRVAVLRDPANLGTAQSLKETEAAAQPLKLHVESLEVRNSKDFEAAFQAATTMRASALMVLAGGLFNTHRPRIVKLAAESRLPTMYSEPEYVVAGGLMSYATNIEDLYRRAATSLTKFLKVPTQRNCPLNSR
jgi:putative tryptophan/tyrosine transport system substrate-binding protein